MERGVAKAVVAIVLHPATMEMKNVQPDKLNALRVIRYRAYLVNVVIRTKLVSRKQMINGKPRDIDVRRQTEAIMAIHLTVL